MAGLTPRNLPFEVEQLVEARSFLAGFRGAWFRCKIKGFRNRNKQLGVDLEYIDFPDEKIKWTKLYQKSNGKRQLMIRPSFPNIYGDFQQSNSKNTSEVIVIVKDAWKVGDCVDWWASDCYWSGRVKEKLGHEKFQVDLLPLPDGEGLTYEAYSKDFRPSLNWSVEHGWKLPDPQDNKNFRPCARLITPMEVHAVDKDRKRDQAVSRAALHSEKNLADPISSSCNLDAMRDGNCGGTPSDGVASSHVKGASVNIATDADVSDDHPPKKMRSETNKCNHPGTIESAILDLEELLNRVKWIKSILKPSPNSMQPPWEFIEHANPPPLK